MRHIISCYTTGNWPESQDVELDGTLNGIEADREHRINAQPSMAKGLFRRAEDRNEGIQAKRIDGTEWIVGYVSVEVALAGCEPDRVLADKALVGWAVVARPVIVEAGAVVFPTRVLEGIRVVLARGHARPEGLICVGALHCAGVVGQGQRGAQGIA